MSGVGTVAPGRDRAPGRRRRTAVGIGLAGVLLVFAVLAALQAVTIHPYHPPDEMSHVGYAVEVGRGDLPTIDTPIPTAGDPLLRGKVRNSRPANRTVWTANHPPLYYLAAAVPLRAGLALDRPVAGLRAARLLTVGIGLAGLVLVVLLARELLPGRPELWVGAGGLAALLPVQVLTSAVVYNDALAFTLGAGVLLVVARLLRWGPTPRRLALLAVLAAAAALTRASGLILVGVAAAAAAVAVWRAADRPGRGRLLRAAGAGGAVVLAAAAAAGWFYLRNRSLYGSVTGTGALLEKFARGERGPVPRVLLDGDFWHGQLRRLWDDSAGPTGRNGFTRWWYLTFVPVLGLVLAGVRGLRRAVPPPAPLVLCWLACLGVAGLVELSAASFYGLGGTAHGRYLVPALAVLAVAAAAGLAGLPGRRALPLLLAMPLLVAVNVHVWARYLDVTLNPPASTDPVSHALRYAGVPVWVLVPAAALVLAGLAAQLWALWTLSARRAGPVAMPTPTPRELVPTA